VVGDNPWDEELLVRQMRQAQMTESMLFAQNGWQALELIEDSRKWGWRFSAIFLDLQLPDMEGITLTKRIRGITGMERIPVIVTGGSENPRERLECERLEITGYLEKPITTHSFAKATEAIR
jgi:CheY-like chemotaxis protein